MSSPIPDAVLRHISGWGKGGIDHSLPFSPQAVARELLALRAAAGLLVLRRSAMADQCLCGHVFAHEHGAKAMAEAWASHAETCSIERLRALLPKEAP